MKMDFMYKELGRFILFSGFILVIFGILLILVGKFNFFIGKLPGDINIKGKNFSFYFPIVSCLLISAILTLIFYFLRRR